MTAPKQALASKPFLATAPRFVDAGEAERLQQAIQNRIAQRAHQLYEESGYQSGNDQRHWFQAEAEVVQRTLTVRESGSWITIIGDLPGSSAEDVQIFVDPRRIIVTTKSPDAESAASTERAAEHFFMADLQVDVQPSTAAASLKDEKLSLMVKKSFPAAVAPIDFARR